eukprot:6394255-Lingulodinium_polyedra.AAC.1
MSAGHRRRAEAWIADLARGGFLIPDLFQLARPGDIMLCVGSYAWIDARRRLSDRDPATNESPPGQGG